MFGKWLSSSVLFFLAFTFRGHLITWISWLRRTRIQL
jgi:hypothetical protein